MAFFKAAACGHSQGESSDSVDPLRGNLIEREERHTHLAATRHGTGSTVRLVPPNHVARGSWIRRRSSKSGAGFDDVYAKAVPRLQQSLRSIAGLHELFWLLGGCDFDRIDSTILFQILVERKLHFEFDLLESLHFYVGE